MPETTNDIRVLLVDDHAQVRTGVRAVLEDEEGITVVGEADSGESALLMTIALRPNLIVMDVNMPGMDGLEATKRLKAIHPEIAVVILTVNDAELFLVEAIRSGASSYLLKDAISDQLVSSIRLIAEGGSLIPLHLLRAAMAQESAVGNSTVLEGELLEPLTDKEMEVLKRIVKGLKNQEIADELHLAHVTIKKRVQSILAKMTVSDRTQAALKAIKLKIVTL
jgi:DNA-binding NarL/FixJ family response regulator